MDFMCGRFAVTTDPALLAEKIKAIDEATPAEKDAARQPNYNVAPTTTVSTVVKRHSEPDDESTRRVRLMRWGLVPPWAKTGERRRPGHQEGSAADQRPRRDGHHVGGVPQLRQGQAVPGADGRLVRVASQRRDRIGEEGAEDAVLHVRRRRRAAVHGGVVVDVAARRTVPKDAAPLLSCTIITTDSAGPLAEIHDRMPLTISEADWDRWLDPDAPIDEGLLRGHGDLDRIEIREVSRLVNSVRNNGPELIEPAEPEQPTLL